MVLEKESFALQICLKGEALSWFNSLPEHVSRNFQHTLDALRCKYYSATYVWIQRLKLSERRQEITSFVDNYASDIMRYTPNS